jgi:hypothetical protein
MCVDFTFGDPFAKFGYIKFVKSIIEVDIRQEFLETIIKIEGCLF